jgi:hypothetical protein
MDASIPTSFCLGGHSIGYIAIKRYPVEAMTEEEPTSCANCGKEECGETKKRAAELHDEALFRQPPKGDDCPICFLMLPFLGSGKTFVPCCGKNICTGCFYAHFTDRSQSCPFCRAAMPTGKKYTKMLEKRVDANDARAIYILASKYVNIKKNKAVKLFHRAAELGFVEAYNDLGAMYDKGIGVSKDVTKAQQYYEKGAKAGCTFSRFTLGIIDAKACSFDRATKHWLIAASSGDIRAVNEIKKAMVEGNATKDHYAQALRGYKQYLDEVRSPHRDRAAANNDWFKYLATA